MFFDTVSLMFPRHEEVDIHLDGQKTNTSGLTWPGERWMNFVDIPEHPATPRPSWSWSPGAQRKKLCFEFEDRTGF